jgi:hypothetical protein
MFALSVASGFLIPPWATFPAAFLRSRTVGFPESGSDLGPALSFHALPAGRWAQALVRIRPQIHRFAMNRVSPTDRHGFQHCVWMSSLTSKQPSAQSPFASDGSCAPRWVPSRSTSGSVTSPSSLIRTHAPDHPAPAASGFPIGLQVFAGCHQPLLPNGPSRHYLHNLCVGAWTHTPLLLSGASTHFFPESLGLAPRETRSAHRTIPAKQLPQGAGFRSCSHSLHFKLPRSPGPQIAPTATHASGRRARYTTHTPCGCPLWGVALLHVCSWAIDMIGLSPIRLWPCRPLLPAPGSHLRSTDDRSVARARDERCGRAEADSAPRIAGSSPPSIELAGFASGAGDARRTRRAGETSPAPVHSWGHHNSCSAHESRSRATDVVPPAAHAFVASSPRAAPTASPRASSGRYAVAAGTCHRALGPRCA